MQPNPYTPEQLDSLCAPSIEAVHGGIKHAVVILMVLAFHCVTASRLGNVSSFCAMRHMGADLVLPEILPNIFAHLTKLGLLKKAVRLFKGLVFNDVVF